MVVVKDVVKKDLSETGISLDVVKRESLNILALKVEACVTVLASGGLVLR